jgi:hypothetical protein
MVHLGESVLTKVKFTFLRPHIAHTLDFWHGEDQPTYYYRRSIFDKKENLDIEFEHIRCLITFPLSFFLIPLHIFQKSTVCL